MLDIRGTKKVRSPRRSKDAPIIDEYVSNEKQNVQNVQQNCAGESTTSQKANESRLPNIPKIQISDRSKDYPEDLSRFGEGNQTQMTSRTSGERMNVFQPLTSRNNPSENVEASISMYNINSSAEKSFRRGIMLYDSIAPSGNNRSISWKKPKDITASVQHRGLSTRELVHRFSRPMQSGFELQTGKDVIPVPHYLKKLKSLHRIESNAEDQETGSRKVNKYQTSRMDLSPLLRNDYNPKDAMPSPLRVSRPVEALSKAASRQIDNSGRSRNLEQRILPLIGALADHARLSAAHEAAASALEAHEPDRLAMLGRFLDLARSANESSGEAAAALESFVCLRSGLEALAQDLGTRQGPRRGSCSEGPRGFRGQLERVVGETTWDTIENFMGGYAAGIGRPVSPLDPPDAAKAPMDFSEDSEEGDPPLAELDDSSNCMESSSSEEDEDQAASWNPDKSKRQNDDTPVVKQRHLAFPQPNVGEDIDYEQSAEGTADAGVVLRVTGPATLANALESRGMMGSAASLRILNCAHSGLRCSGMVGLVSLVQNAGKSVTSLDLRNNGILEEGCNALARVMRDGHCPCLINLLLGDNRVGKAAEAIATAVNQSCCELYALSLAKNDLSDAVLARVLESLAGHPTLADLDFAQNRAGSLTCEGFGTFLGETTQLTALDCSWGQMRNKSALSFVKSLAKATLLVRLNLSWNGLGDPNIVCHLGDMIGSIQCKIEELDLSHCRMDGRAAHVLAGRLVLNKSLKVLKLDGNPLGAAGVRRLLSTCMMPNAELERGGEREISLSVKDCSVNTESSFHIFNPAEPAGHYVLDMSEPYSQSIVESLLRIEAMGRGAFERVSMTLAGKQFVLARHTDLETSPITPKEGEMVFNYEARIAAAKSKIVGEGFGLPGRIHQRLMNVFAGKQISFETGLDRIGFLQLVMSEHSEVKLQQATELLSHLKIESDRVTFVAQVFSDI